MATCELLPLCPDTELNDDTERVLTEPVEVGPYFEGVLFIKIMEMSESADLTVELGISPYGYEKWEEHWTTLDTLNVDSEGMHAFPIDNFGGWIRLNLLLDGDANGEVALQSWFTGKG